MALIFLQENLVLKILPMSSHRKVVLSDVAILLQDVNNRNFPKWKKQNKTNKKQKRIKQSNFIFFNQALLIVIIGSSSSRRY